MNRSRTIHLTIGNALPNGNAAESASVLALWQEINLYFRKRPFTVAAGTRRESRSYVVSLDTAELLIAMETAFSEAGSFEARRQEHANDPGKFVSASMKLEIAVADGVLDEAEAYEVATFFLQQLVIAVNLVQPGACRLLQTSFRGDSGHRYEAQAFDSRLYYGAFRNLRDLGWWRSHNPGFHKVWQWLEHTDGSHGMTAIKDLDKVLFTMIKVAEQRNELGSRTALLVIYQLETLLDCRSPMDARHLRNRIRLILGDMPEAADCINELYVIRDGLLLGSRPVQRPPLVAHDEVAEFLDQVDCYNNPVEMGIAVVLVLLRELISHDAEAFAFTENVELVKSKHSGSSAPKPASPAPPARSCAPSATG